jgi:hypothetical protein
MNRMTGYFHMLTGSAPRMQLQYADIINIIIAIFSCDAMQLLITAEKWYEREKECDETTKTRAEFENGNGDRERR